MKKMIISAFAILASASVFAQSKGIVFEHGTFSEVQQKAKQLNKPIFMDAYTTWCGPCKAMAANIFTNDSVAQYYNQNFVCYKSDMEKGEGIDLAKKYEVYAYPNLLYIDADGNVLHRAAGSRKAADFINLGKTSLNTTERFAAVQQQYAANKSDTKIATKYITMLSGAALPHDKVLNDYFASMPESDYISRNNWKLVYELVDKKQYKIFDYVVTNRAKYSALYTKDSVENYINGVYLDYLNTIAQRKPAKFDSVYNVYQSLKLAADKNTMGELTYARASASMAKKDWKNYNTLISEFVKNYAMDNANQLNQLAWTAYEKIDDKAVMANAEKWAAQAYKLEPEYAIMDTYSAVLYKNKKYKEAQKMAEKAIEKGKKDGEDIAETAALLSKIKANIKK